MCVLWFLRLASHHRRSGRRLCNVLGSGSSTHLEIYVVRVTCDFADLCACSYGIIAAMTAQASGFPNRSPPLIENLDEMVASCNNPALLAELISGIMCFLHRPIFRIVREYPGTETKVRAHQMTRKLRVDSAKIRAELSSNRSQRSRSAPAVSISAIAVVRQCFVQQLLTGPPLPLFGTPEKVQAPGDDVRTAFSQAEDFLARPARTRSNISANFRSSHTLMRSWMT